MNENQRGNARNHLLLLFASCAGLWGWNYGLWDLWGPDESRYVQIAKEILSSNHWFLLTVHDEPYAQKPPLPFWMFAAMLKLSGGKVCPWTVRLPSILLATCTVLLTYLIGRKRFGERAGFIAAFVLMTAPLFPGQAATARLDILFTGWATAALWVWLTRDEAIPLSPVRAAGFWFFLACAFFTKGPLALVIVLAPVIGEAIRARSMRPLVQSRAAVGAPVLLALIGGWLWLEAAHAKGGFVEDQVVETGLSRIFASDHANPIWYYAVSLISGPFLPWIFFLIPALIYLWRNRRTIPRGTFFPILIWIIVPLILFHIATGKRRQYLLPIFPPMALIVGWYIDSRVLIRKVSARFAAAATAISILLMVLLAGFSVFAWVSPERLWKAGFMIRGPQIVTIVPFLLLFAWVALNARRKGTPGAYLATLVCIMWGFGYFDLSLSNPALNPRKSAVSFTRSVEAILAGGKQVVGANPRAGDSFYHVYGNYTVREIRDGRALNSDPATLPDVWITRKEEEKKARFLPSERGYHQVLEMNVDSDDMAVYKRDEPAGTGGSRESPSNE